MSTMKSSGHCVYIPLSKHAVCLKSLGTCVCVCACVCVCVCVFVCCVWCVHPCVCSESGVRCVVCVCVCVFVCVVCCVWCVHPCVVSQVCGVLCVCDQTALALGHAMKCIFDDVTSA